MSFGSEFKEFAMKGNVIDLAVGVIIGSAFGKFFEFAAKTHVFLLVCAKNGRQTATLAVSECSIGRQLAAARS